jgi:hypothetical protein
VLLLPEYSDRDKLVNLLMKAIKECKVNIAHVLGYLVLTPPRSL